MHQISAQRHKIHRAVNYVTENITQQLDLNVLADVACLSKFHFSRVFRDQCGETPYEYLSRIRLELAARSLNYIEDKSITDIALDCGFSNPQNFSRSFRLKFGVSPRSFRNNRLINPREFASSPGSQLVLLDDLDIQIVTQPDYRVAYIRHHGPYGQNDTRIPAKYSALQAWARRIGIWDDTSALIGLCPDNPILTPPNLCRYDICIPVDSGMMEDDIVSIQTIPGGAYARLRISCEGDEMLGYWKLLTRYCIEENSITHALTYSYEYYPCSQRDPLDTTTDVELYLKIHSGLI